ncbi:thymidylate synthase [Aeromonas phage 4_4572]|uniref:Thymidylate synthase n=4 Tax=Lahexavirus TaxID=2843411 RepID=A0A5B9N974_9CAUD|nr:thymidylate synthase [Aeromonas phage 4_4572]QEG09022.1 thymidylate synthase [Aeromonas phage 4_4572]
MKGISIKLVDQMGDDFRVFEAAKATLGGEGESQFSREDTNPTRLIRFLAKERHVTPFRHPQVTFECEAPIAIARQLGKHQAGFSWNERSMRYRDSVIDVFTPEMFRGRPDKLHDGSTDEDVKNVMTDYKVTYWSSTDGHYEEYLKISDVFDDIIEKALDAYECMVKAGLAPEQARFILPQGMITRWMWTGSLWGWFEVYRQRSSEHAQSEVREFARLLDEQMSVLFPIAWSELKGTIKQEGS